MNARTLLTPQEVSGRWEGRISTKTLANWRSSEPPKGPSYKKLGSRIFYPLDKVIEFEERNQFSSTAEYSRNSVKSEVEQAAEALNAKLEALQHDHDQQQQILLQERARQDRKLAKERAQEDAERGQALELRRRQLIDSASPLVAPPKRRTGRPRNDEKPWVVVPVVKRLRGRPRKVRN